jgi:predicted DsbA family dithiol-disulfide isomerase
LRTASPEWLPWLWRCSHPSHVSFQEGVTVTELALRPIVIDVWSDIACPWCYIGKRRLEAGLAEYAERDDALPVTVEFHSYELSPDTPVDFAGSEIDFLVQHKRLGEADVRRMLQRVTDTALGVGLEYDFAKLQHTNTVKAHELLHYAKAHGVQLEMTERLMRAYFVEGRHVGRNDDLADLAAEIGLDRNDVLRSLAADEYLADVRADQAQGQAYGLRGVPFFVLDQKYAVSGAQPVEAFVDVLTEVATDRTAHPA